MSRYTILSIFTALLLAGCGQATTDETGARETMSEPAAAASASVSPEPALAPAIYRSADKNLTFPTPAGAFYCPKPEGWTGSDHGTVIMLARPAACGGSGYSSSSQDALLVPNIQIFYGYDVLDPQDRPARPPCREIGRVKVLGDNKPICRVRDGAIIEVRVDTPYRAEGADADIEAEAVFTLVTDAARFDADLMTFRALVEAASTCNRTDVDRPPYANNRPDCAPEAVWY